MGPLQNTVTWGKNTLLDGKRRSGAGKIKKLHHSTTNMLSFQGPTASFAIQQGPPVPCDRFPAKDPLSIISFFGTFASLLTVEHYETERIKTLI